MKIYEDTPNEKQRVRELSKAEVYSMAKIGNIQAINDLIDSKDLDINIDTIKILKMILGRE